MNRCSVVCIIAVIGLTACANSATKTGGSASGIIRTDDFAELCRTTLKDCRGPGAVDLLKEDGSRLQLAWTVNQPVVQGDLWATVFPGETVYLEAEIAGHSIVALRSVPAITAAEKTITLSFEQITGKTDMSLTIVNPFSRRLKYRLGMALPDRDGLFKTSSCPVIADGRNFEHWPHPILQLVLTDFRLLGDDAPMVCE